MWWLARASPRSRLDCRCNLGAVKKAPYTRFAALAAALQLSGHAASGDHDNDARFRRLKALVLHGLHPDHCTDATEKLVRTKLWQDLWLSVESLSREVSCGVPGPPMCAKVRAMDTEVIAPERLFTVEEYHRMGEAGVFDDDQRVELVDGKVVLMSPIGPRHQLAVEALAELLSDAVDRQKVRVRQQGPVLLNDRTEHYPDVALIRYPWPGYPGEHPGINDILLVAGVSDATARDDRLRKLPLYARAGVREVWQVDLTQNLVTVYRAPDQASGRCARDFEVRPDGMLEVEALPGVAVPAAPVFYPSRG